MTDKEDIFEEIHSHPLAQKILERQHPKIYPESFVKFKPKDCYLPKYYADYYDSIKSFEVRDDDIWLVSLPKSGTTWTSEMVWLISNNLDYAGAQESVGVRFPYLEFSATWMPTHLDGLIRRRYHIGPGENVPSTMDIINQTKLSPRFVQTHLPLNLLPTQLFSGEKSPKIIYVARNPKDVCVSYYHFRILIEGYSGTIDDTVEEYINDLALYTPYWTHVSEFWEERNNPNVFFMTFEQSKSDLKGMVLKLSNFLNKSYSPIEIDKLVNHLSFDTMKNNPGVNHNDLTDYFKGLHGVDGKTQFMRAGGVGGWRNELSPQSIAAFDAWIDENNKKNGLWDELWGRKVPDFNKIMP